MDFPSNIEEVLNLQKELSYLASNLMERLKDYNEVEQIVVDDQKSITIDTKMNGTNIKIRKKAEEIEEKVKDFIRDGELIFVSENQSYNVIVKNSKGKIIN